MVNSDPRPFPNTGLLRLNDTLASNMSVNEDDVLKVKQHLNTLGHYDTPSYGMTPWPDHQLFDGIRSFQREKNLTVDGYMKPQGETEQALNEAVALRVQPDPVTEKTEALVAFGKTLGIPEAKARYYLANYSGLRRKDQEGNDGGANREAQALPQTIKPQPVTNPVKEAESGTPPSAPSLIDRVRERADSRRPPAMPDGFLNSLVDDDFMDGVPDSKIQVVKNNMNGWREAQMERWKTGTPLATDYALRTIFAFEGGMKPTAEGGEEATAAGGITNKTLQLFKSYAQQSDAALGNNPIRIAARNRLRDAGIDKVEHPKDLNAAQAMAFAKSYHDDNMYRIGGHEAVELIDNRQAGAALMDSLYRHGSPNGTRAIQKAINQVRPNSVKEDGIMGETTFNIYKEMADDPKTWEKLSNNLVNQRILTAQEEKLANKFAPVVDAGDLVRFRYFVPRSQRQTP